MVLKAPFEPEIAAILKRVGNKKKSAIYFEHVAGGSVTLRSYWSGGSISHHRAWNAGGYRIPLPVGGSAFDPPADAWVPEVGDILVTTGLTAGKTSYPCITRYIAPQEG
jgi:hypothetical protein